MARNRVTESLQPRCALVTVDTEGASEPAGAEILEEVLEFLVCCTVIDHNEEPARLFLCHIAALQLCNFLGSD